MLEGHSKTLFLSLKKKTKQSVASHLLYLNLEGILRHNTVPDFRPFKDKSEGGAAALGGGGGESHLGVIGVHLHLLREQNVPQLLI